MNRKASLSSRFILVLVGIVLFTASSILVVNWLGTIDHAKRQVSNELKVGIDVFQQSYKQREQTLLTTAKVLSSDFGFKRAVATGDSLTIASALANHSQRINANLMGLLDLSGNVEVMSLNGEQADVSKMKDKAPLNLELLFQQGYIADVIERDGKLYQSIYIPIEAPNPIAIAWIGFLLDQTFVNQLASLTGLGVTLMQVGLTQNNEFLLSSLTSKLVANAVASVGADVSMARNLMFGHGQFMSESIQLGSNGSTNIVLSANISELIAGFRLTTLQTLAIAGLEVILAMILGIRLTTRTVQPLIELRDAATSVADGDYQTDIKPSGNTTELIDLASSFSRMQYNIQQREKHIRYQAEHDALTGLNNRARITTIIEEQIKNDEFFQVITFCLNDFREINETFGFAIGDKCTTAVADILRISAGSAARISGGEFIWLPTQKQSDDDLIALAKRLENAVREDDLEINTDISVGVAHYPTHANSAEELLRRAGIAVHTAKLLEVPVKTFHPKQEQTYIRRLEILNELKRLLSSERNELAMYYQPKMHTASGEVSRFEALIRWNSASLGFVSPELFIPIAEKAGIIMQITEWVIRRVVMDISAWNMSNIKVAINLSVYDLTSPTLLDYTLQTLEEYSLPTSVLSFEVTESGIMEETERAVSELHRWRQAGFNLSIDDFGTGHSSLAYVKTLPVNELKIDKSFVLQLVEQPEDRVIVQAIKDLAAKFGLEVVAEGVENEESLALLRSYDVEWIQGYHISRPLPPDDVIAWCDSFKAKQRKPLLT